jgi:hypothetical protein
MRAWWVYWLTIGIGVLLWVGALVIAGRDGFRELLRQPLWLLILLSPLVAAGVNLVLYRASHEDVCRYEVGRHPWLRYVVGRGYSAGMFAWTGVVLLGVALLILAAILANRL